MHGATIKIEILNFKNSVLVIEFPVIWLNNLKFVEGGKSIFF